MFAFKHCKFVNFACKHCYQCKHEKLQNVFFSELSLTKDASITTCFIGAGAALENLPYDLSVHEYLVKYLIIWASFYWEVARTLRGIVMIIRYIFGQLFFMPFGVTCQTRSKEVPINVGTWRFEYSLYYVCIEVYSKIFCGSYEFSRYLLQGIIQRNTLNYFLCVCVYVVLLHCNIIRFYEIPRDTQRKK